MTEKISTIFDYYPGNHGLTEEIIYEYQPLANDDSIPIFSGSQDNIFPIGFIRRISKNKAGEDIKIFDPPCLILTKDGSAGVMTYRDKGIFTINHHACVLKLKNEWKGKIDEEWFAQQFKSHLLQVVTSKSDNRVFSTEWFDRLEFPIIPYGDQIRQKIKKKLLIELKKTIVNILDETQGLCKRQLKVENYEYGSQFISVVFNIIGGNNGLTEEFIYHNLPITST